MSERIVRNTFPWYLGFTHDLGRMMSTSRCRATSSAMTLNAPFAWVLSDPTRHSGQGPYANGVQHAFLPVCRTAMQPARLLAIGAPRAKFCERSGPHQVLHSFPACRTDPVEGRSQGH